MKTSKSNPKNRRRNVADCPDEYFFNPNYDRSSDYYTLENEHGETQADMDVVRKIIDDNKEKGNGRLTGRFWVNE